MLLHLPSQDPARAESQFPLLFLPSECVAVLHKQA